MEVPGGGSTPAPGAWARTAPTNDKHACGEANPKANERTAHEAPTDRQAQIAAIRALPEQIAELTAA